ncbi:glycosyltransferase family 4 protein [Methanosarcina sp. WH1]|uniref:glycosyltransferase family 4 protein n=2 Tax=unclassified Methanosarcina TaxID=2644672 RepID=UPI000615D873|nr:glycosyltransferase family 4 protein [Methanosarcina sp. WH1]AKB17635.1 Glycosyl transferase, group 1 [Methanosarcina sp. WWM596]AKB21003.1 Glycosyl transferase, group 1 [Methanosarcina sp. WH1]
MNVLHVMPYIPSPTSGALVRDYNIIKQLSKKGIKSHLICNICSNKYMNDINLLEDQLNIKIHPLKTPYFSALYKMKIVIFDRMYPEVHRFNTIDNRNFISSLLSNNDFNIIHAQHSVEAEPTIQAALNSNFNGCKILTLHNVDHLNFIRQTDHQKNPLMKMARKRVSLRFKEHELDMIQKFDHLFVVSDIDKSVFMANGIPEDKIDIIPNGVDCSSFNISKFHGEDKLIHPNILFMGKLSYQPNIIGIKNYLKYIHPLIKNKISNIKLYIIGKECPDWLIKYSRTDDSVEVIGFVEDVKPYIFGSDVCIAPLTSGSGTRLKILEYMAMSKPVVSTTIGAEGLEVENNKNILIADIWNEFADRIIEVLNDKELATTIGNNSRKLVEDKYDWNKIAEKQANIYRKLINKY